MSPPKVVSPQSTSNTGEVFPNPEQFYLRLSMWDGQIFAHPTMVDQR